MILILTKNQIDQALPKVKEGLQKYLWLQNNRAGGCLLANSEFRRKFNHFYGVRREIKWQDKFYNLMDLVETNRIKGQRITFDFILKGLHDATGRYEASFSSKLLATVDPNMPIIDSIVLKNLNVKLPRPNTPDRLEKISEVYKSLCSVFAMYLTSEDGHYLVGQFEKGYSDAKITKFKMLDLILWQTRPSQPPANQSVPAALSREP